MISENLKPRMYMDRNSVFVTFRRTLMVVVAIVAVCQFSFLTASAQRPRYDKLSPMLRSLVRRKAVAEVGEASKLCSSSVVGEASKLCGSFGEHVQTDVQEDLSSPPREVCAFVKLASGGEDALLANGCRLLAQEGDICIANIPVSKLSQLSLDSRIVRIEANRGMSLQSDSLAYYLNALPVYEGQYLPQAFTGRDVVVGVMDVGFDLTHPTFYSRDTTEYRIRCFWDMLSADTLGTDANGDGQTLRPLPVGRDYVGREALLAVAHARDGLMMTHGTHTAGIAAGSGYSSPYRGMAPESDICLVANAVTSDTVFIDPADYYKYTYALDALGFKYIFDYAESVGKPCVINFSEGSQQDFWGYDLLYYEMLRRISGPGRIIVSAAGNSGNEKTWFRKQRGEMSAGVFLKGTGREAMVTVKGDDDFHIRLVAYENNERDTLLIPTAAVVQPDDSLFTGYVATASDSVRIDIEAYPSCYNPDETCYDVLLTGSRNVGVVPRLSVEVMGGDADVEVYRVTGSFIVDIHNLALDAGDNTHTVLSPATAPSLISVGASYYRPYIINYKGEKRTAASGNLRERNKFSSIGPTFDGRTKPDVMAPGINIISSYSSYYLESQPNANDINYDVEHFPFNGRTYAWNANSGSSMSSPAVAGAIALWMQAKPDLTVEEVLDVFSHTCHQYDESLPHPNNYYGYGEIDVYRGLLYLLGMDRIEDVSIRPTEARISLDGNRLAIDCGTPLPSPSRLRLFSLSGKLVYDAKLPAGRSLHTLLLPRLPSAVYAVQIDGAATVRGSQLIRMTP